MGILTAVPTSTIEIHDVDIVRLSDTYPWPNEEQPSSLWETYVTKPLAWLTGGWMVSNQQPPQESPWSMAKRRFNVCITTTLKFRDSKPTTTESTTSTTTTENNNNALFCVANYHMPCCYYAPIVMTLHADAYLAHVQRIAASTATGSSSSTIPYIVTGDFNIVPSEIVYRFLTQTKTVPTDSVAYPKSSETLTSSYAWTPAIQSTVRSAYAVATGTEPDFTNYAQTTPEEDPFIDTLDYIFISELVRVRNVLPLPHRDNVEGPFPNAEEPSDHVLIAADLELPFWRKAIRAKTGEIRGSMICNYRIGTHASSMYKWVTDPKKFDCKSF